MKTDKLYVGIISILLMSSCMTQQKTVQLANGKMVTQQKYDRMLDKSFKEADKAGRRAVKGQMSKKDIDSLNKDLEVTVDTTQN